jgi:hypothetical protein
MQLSEALTELDTMVAMARTLNDVDLANISFIQLPIVVLEEEYFGRVGVDQEASDELFSLIASGTTFAVDDGKLVVDKPQTESAETEQSPSNNSDDIQGITADQSVCSN